MEPTDAELVARSLEGEQAAFSALVTRHSAPLWTAVRRALRDRELARDVFQETWVRALEGLSALREPKRVRSWLLSIALNLTRQKLRRPAPSPLSSEVSEPPTGASRSAGEGAEQRAELDRALAELTRRQREVVELRIHFEQSYAEIADTLGTTEESARASFYQAVRRLRASLAEEELA